MQCHRPWVVASEKPVFSSASTSYLLHPGSTMNMTFFGKGNQANPLLTNSCFGAFFLMKDLS